MSDNELSLFSSRSVTEIRVAVRTPPVLSDASASLLKTVVRVPARSAWLPT